MAFSQTNKSAVKSCIIAQTLSLTFSAQGTKPVPVQECPIVSDIIMKRFPIMKRFSCRSGHVPAPYSDAFNDFLPKQALWTDHKKRQRQHVSEPVLCRSSDHGADGKFKQSLADTDDQASDDSSGN